MFCIFCMELIQNCSVTLTFPVYTKPSNWLPYVLRREKTASEVKLTVLPMSKA